MMAITFGDNQYGKAEVRLVHGHPHGDRHQISDLNVSTALRGDFADAHLLGDNAKVVATDTQKNTVYALAQQHGVGEIEEFALRLGRHFVDSSRGDRREDQHRGVRLGPDHGGRRRPRARVLPARGRAPGPRSSLSTEPRPGWCPASTDLVVLKSTGSEFAGFPRDRYTTLAETTDRILATAVTARWRYAGTEADWARGYADVRRILVESFAVKHSLALQQTLYYMGEQVLQAHPEVAEIRMSMPNKHHFLVDLSPFGLPNDNEVYYAADRPYGLIEGTVTRDDAPGPAGPGRPSRASEHILRLPGAVRALGYQSLPIGRILPVFSAQAAPGMPGTCTRASRLPHVPPAGTLQPSISIIRKKLFILLWIFRSPRAMVSR